LDDVINTHYCKICFFVLKIILIDL